MPAEPDRLDRRRAAGHEGELWGSTRRRTERALPPEGPVPAPVSERSIYRAGGNGAREPNGRGQRRTPAREGGPAGPATKRRRSPVLALLVLVAIAVIIALTGVAARGGGLNGSQDAGTFKLLPITTTTTS